MKNKSVITLILVLSFIFSELTFCQSLFTPIDDTVQSHYFLWFHGRWNNKKKNVFDISTPTGTGKGGTATVSSDGNVNIQTAGIDDWRNYVDKGIDDVDKWDKDLKSPAKDYKEWDHHLNLVLLPELNRLKQEWNSYKITKDEKKVDLEQQRLQELANKINESCSSFKSRYE